MLDNSIFLLYNIFYESCLIKDISLNRRCMEIQENTSEKNIYEFFKELSWAGTFAVDEKNKIILYDGEVVFEEKTTTSVIKFFLYNRDTRDVVPRSCVEYLEFDNDIKPQELLEFWSGGQSGGGYCISYNYSIFQKILQIRDRRIEKIKVSKTYEGIKKQKNVLQISFNEYLEVKKRTENIESQGKSSKDALQRYLINNSIFDFLNIKIKPTTTTTAGDFKFLLDRFNLSTKKDKSDFNKYLNIEDLAALGEMFDRMIKKEVFPKEYLRKLDAYFIKENLERIIKIGKQILLLKSEEIKTPKAQKIAKKVAPGESISQLETLWQKYFEEYLLYLIFSYRKIIPKVELSDFQDVENKPDFIGINHYGGVDVIEIKTHLKDILVWDNSHKNFAFSSEMSKAVIQIINYMESISRERFKNVQDKKEIIRNTYGKQNLYHPRGIIVISSKEKIFKGRREIDKDRLERDFTKLRNSIQNIQVLTFDEILNMAERYSDNIAANYEKG